jgi:hypothetical protein
MLALVVNSRLHPRRRPLSPSSWDFSTHSISLLGISTRFLTSAFCFLPYPLLPLCFQSLPTIRFCNPLVLITIRIAGGVGTPLALSCNDRCRFASLFSITSKMLPPQLFCFQLFALLPGGGWVPPSVHVHPFSPFTFHIQTWFGPQQALSETDPYSPTPTIPFQTFRRANDVLPLQ